MTETERFAWVQLAFTPYIGAESFAQLIEHCGSAEAALKVPVALVAQLGRYGKQAAAAWHDTDKAKMACEAAFNWEKQPDCRLLFGHVLFTLCDIQQLLCQKTAFLQQAVIELGLKNVRVISGRVEAAADCRADVITSRAFAELADFVNWTEHLLKDGGYWAAMKGVYPQEEINKLPENVAVEKVEALHVPQLNAERHIVIIRKKAV